MIKIITNEILEISYLEKSTSQTENVLHECHCDESPSVIISPSFISINNPKKSKNEIYIHVGEKNIRATGNVKMLLEKLKPSISACGYLSYIFEIECEAKSVWNEIYCIPPSSFVTITSERKVEFGEHSLKEEKSNNENPVNVLDEIIKREVSGKSVGIRFSGGLESTAILASCHQLESCNQIVTATWHHNDSSSCRDLEYAKMISSALGIKNIAVHVDEKMIFPESVHLRAWPSTATAFECINNQVNELLLQYLPRDAVLMDGHGGDHLFLQNFPPSMLFSIRNPKVLLEKIKEYCNLYSVTYFDIFRIAFLNGKTVGKEFMTANLKKVVNIADKPQRDRELFIRTAISDTSFFYNYGKEVFYPFTRPDMISAALHYNISDLFDAQHDRKPLRDFVSNKIGGKIPHRIDKGFITGAFQRALKIKEKKLLEIVLSGYGVTEGFISTNAVLNAFKLSSMGINGIDPVLYRIICAEIMISNI